MSKSLFDPHKSLLALGIVRVTASTLLVAFTLVTTAIIFHKDLIWKFDHEGFKYATELFSVPLGIIALAIPVMAILAANHRSEQSREQMRLTSLQNIFSNHYKHVEEFEKYCIRVHDRIIDNDKATKEFYEKSGGVLKHMALQSFIPTNVDSQYSRLLYKKLYPKSISGDMTMSQEFVSSIDLLISDVLEMFADFNTNDKGKWYSAIEGIESNLQSFAERNYIDLRYIGTPKTININGCEIRIPAGDVMAFMRQLQDVVHAIEEVLAFDISYIPSAIVKRISKANLNELPEWDIDNVSSWEPIDISLFLINKHPNRPVDVQLSV